jgi:hypothetical protein
MTARETWLGIRREAWGAPDMTTRQQVFRAPDGSTGVLAECHISGRDSAEPGAWMFRLGQGLAWHWEMELTAV